MKLIHILDKVDHMVIMVDQKKCIIGVKTQSEKKRRIAYKLL